MGQAPRPNVKMDLGIGGQAPILRLAKWGTWSRCARVAEQAQANYKQQLAYERQRMQHQFQHEMHQKLQSCTKW
ncbi:hypothetical protein CCR75_006803 [Bremia lactucae]|uniref:Uncharacterized protein n=1 Tax=Bremia lactucae TaxID=4779 RepID=A0A976FLZ4_BRELC|nr:hypothetical protein CCR75_006803 [Bremia lactucae]